MRVLGGRRRVFALTDCLTALPEMIKQKTPKRSPTRQNLPISTVTRTSLSTRFLRDHRFCPRSPNSTDFRAHLRKDQPRQPRRNSDMSNRRFQSRHPMLLDSPCRGPRNVARRSLSRAAPITAETTVPLFALHHEQNSRSAPLKRGLPQHHPFGFPLSWELNYVPFELVGA